MVSSVVLVCFHDSGTRIAAAVVESRVNQSQKKSRKQVTLCRRPCKKVWEEVAIATSFKGFHQELDMSNYTA